MRNYVLFIHVLGVALAYGGSVAAIIISAMSHRVTPDASLALRKAALSIVRKVVLLGTFTAVGAGIYFAVENPAVFKLRWMHPKLLAVFVALVAVHVDVILSKRLLAAEESGDTGVDVAGRQARAKKVVIARVATSLALLAALFLGAAKPF